MGNVRLGKEVDIALFKEQLAVLNFSTLQIWVDLGFIGLADLLKNTPNAKENVQIGVKRKKKQPLTDAQKIINFEIARVRVKVEHSIGGLKRYYILRNENRLNNPDKNPILDLALECCAGLWNFRRAFKNNTVRI